MTNASGPREAKVAQRELCFFGPWIAANMQALGGTIYIKSRQHDQREQDEQVYEDAKHTEISSEAKPKLIIRVLWSHIFVFVGVLICCIRARGHFTWFFTYYFNIVDL